MKIGNHQSDAAVLAELGSRLKRHRLQRNQTQQQLAEEAGVSKRTIERLESGGSAQLSNFIRICRALGMLERLEPLVPEPLPSPIEQLEWQGKQRRRASQGTTPPRGREWKWEDDS